MTAERRIQIGRTVAWVVLGCVLAVVGCGGAAFDSWAQNVCAQNDAIDTEAEQRLPKTGILEDVHYLDKLRALIERKQALKAEVDAYEAPITRNALRNKLSVALNNSIRYLRALEAQYQIAKKDYEEQLGGDEQIAADPDFQDVQPALRELVTGRAAYRVDPREVMMKRQYEKLYAEVRAELGLPTAGF